MVHPKKDEREDIPNKLCGGSMALIPYSGRHHVEKKNKCYLLCYMFKSERLINLWACVCRSISTCVWGFMHLCTCTEAEEVPGVLCPSLCRFPSGGVSLNLGLLFSQPDWKPKPLSHPISSWVEAEVTGMQEMPSSLHAASMLTCWASSLNSGVKFKHRREKWNPKVGFWWRMKGSFNN